jgi:very-short-patch-repair endonuclease
MADGISQQTKSKLGTFEASKKRKIDAVESESEDDAQLNELLTCQSVTFKGVRYYRGNDLAQLLGYQNPKKAIQVHVYTDNRTVGRNIGMTGNKNAMESRFVIAVGATELIHRSRMPNIFAIADQLGIPISAKHKAYYHEMSTINALMKAFKGERMLYQYVVGDYRIDLYFPDYRLAVECDEKDHRSYNKTKELQRHNCITKELDASWVRYNPDDKDFDIFLVINDIHRHLKRSKRL